MTRPHQADLFARLAPTVHWTAADREQALILLRELLLEATREANFPNQRQTGKEAGDDQDHG